MLFPCCFERLRLRKKIQIYGARTTAPLQSQMPRDLTRPPQGQLRNLMARVRFAQPCRTIQMERSVPETAQRVVNDFCSAVSSSVQTTARVRTSRLSAAFASTPQGQGEGLTLVSQKSIDLFVA